MHLADLIRNIVREKETRPTLDDASEGVYIPAFDDSLPTSEASYQLSGPGRIDDPEEDDSDPRR